MLILWKRGLSGLDGEEVSALLTQGRKETLHVAHRVVDRRGDADTVIVEFDVDFGGI